MFGLDTNVLVRFLLKDDPDQAELAHQRIKMALDSGEVVRISLLTVLETEWVLRSYGKLDKDLIIQTFQHLLETQDVAIEQEEVLEQALFYYKSANADFADCLMVSRYQRSGTTMLTFDAKAGKLPSTQLL